MEDEDDDGGTRSTSRGMSVQDTVGRYVESFIGGIYDGHVREAVICPGSRSTRLALSFSRQRGIRTWTLYDERSAGFFALGIAKISCTPVAVISTSGTAAANLLPAIVESKFSRIPLVAITADRPPELRDFGGAQTIDQVRLYGSHVKWFQDMPIAADSLQLLRYSRLVGLRASSVAKSPPAGPVHINFSFREPLLPETPNSESREPNVSNEVFVVGMRRDPNDDELEAAAKGIRHGSRGVIVAGPGEYEGIRGDISSLSRTLGWPVLADSLSNLRQDRSIHGLVRCYPFLLRNKKFRESMAPEWVIRLGGVPTSKDLATFCEGVSTILLDEGGGWRDPDFSVSRMIHGDLKVSVSTIARTLKNFRRPPKWLSVWKAEDNRIERIAAAVMEGVQEPFEGKLFLRLSRILKPYSPLTVVVGNSMPVRDLDHFFIRGDRDIHLVANRGANGVDGLVSTAMGISAREGNVLLILGDVSFYHDMNGLLASKLYGLKATIVVINNRGAGIFSFLAQHSLPKKTFEQLFGEPHDMDFSGVRTIYGGAFTRVADWRSFEKVLSGSIKAPGLKVIEFDALDRESNLSLHRRFFEEISSHVGGSTGSS